MDVEGNLRLEFVGEQTQRLLLIRRLFAEPEVVEPFDDAILQLQRHTSERHVGLDAVKFR